MGNRVFCILLGWLECKYLYGVKVAKKCLFRLVGAYGEKRRLCTGRAFGNFWYMVLITILHGTSCRIYKTALYYMLYYQMWFSILYYIVRRTSLYSFAYYYIWLCALYYTALYIIRLYGVKWAITADITLYTTHARGMAKNGSGATFGAFRGWRLWARSCGLLAVVV